MTSKPSAMIFLTYYFLFILMNDVGPASAIAVDDLYPIHEDSLELEEGDDMSVEVTIDPPFPFFGDSYSDFFVSYLTAKYFNRYRWL